MTTINGVTFNMKTLEPIVVQRNVISEQPGSDSNFVSNMGYKGLELRITGYEKTLADYDNVISEFMKTGVQVLIHRTGWQYSVYTSILNPVLLDGVTNNFYPYNLTLLTTTPYRESTTETTRPKTITTNNQEWTADDSTNDIDTSGSVDAIPDIQVTGGAPAATLSHRYGLGTDDLDATEYFTTSESYLLKKTFTYTAMAGTAYHLDTVAVVMRISDTDRDAYVKVTYQAASLSGGVETQIVEWITDSQAWTPKTNSPDLQAAINETLTIRYYLRTTDSLQTAGVRDLESNISDYRTDICEDPVVYNVADTSVTSEVANEVLESAIHRINIDGTGTVDYDDNFTTDKFVDAYFYMSGVTHDTGDDELDIADDGYIYWKCDTKGPVTGIPTLTAQINITSGIPTIQISSDGSTWYDITTAIVDDVETVYELDSSSLHLKKVGAVEFYWRFDCVKAAAATCSIKSFELDIDIVTIDIEHPKISSSGVSTFRCDQHVDSGMNCIISLKYRDRSWPA